MARDSRLLIASNRLPFSVEKAEGAFTLRPECGGLAAALGAVHRREDNIWIGWPGPCGDFDATDRARLDTFLRPQRVIPVNLTQTDVVEYYDGVCNSALWPVFHYLLDRLPLVLPEFQSYRAVNARFAETIVREYRRSDIIWIHDYHLLLAPAMIRMRLPDAQIGFFLHTPFPAADVFRVLPWCRELLEGVLGSTLVGFQTARDARNFADAVGVLTDYRPQSSAVVVDDREVRFGAYPIGIDPMRLGRKTEAYAADDPMPGGGARRGRKLLLGVDRLDYTKGIPRRLLAFERLLDEQPVLRGQVELLQVAVPSRAHVPAYSAFKHEVDAIVASINSRYATADWTPVRYVSEALCPADLARLYAAADVMLVTSLRDGMNLVAKEFVLARTDEDGVLILSELAGASAELRDAVLINPYSIEQVARAIADALTLDREERRRRMRALRQQVASHTVDTWVNAFTADLARSTPPRIPLLEQVMSTVQRSTSEGDEVALVFRYEGVLIPGQSGSAMGPDPELIELLRMLRTRSGISVDVVSALPHSVLDGWFERVPATLWAEHGLWRRERDGHRWRRTQWTTTAWMDDVRGLLNQFAVRTPGAFVEEHGSSFVWNFARCESLHGRTQAQMLGALLREAADTLGYMVVEGTETIEVRPAGLTDERTLEKILESRTAACRVLTFDLPGAVETARRLLKMDDVVVTIGDNRTRADVSLTDPRAVRTLLWHLVRALPAGTQADMDFPRRGRMRPSEEILSFARLQPDGLTDSVTTER